MTAVSRAVPRLGTGVFVTLGLVALFAALGGIYWDVTWHATIGRDSFWIPPHLLTYSGVNLFLLSSVGGFGSVWRRAGSLRAALADRVGFGFVVAGLGPLVQIAAAPLDDLWHRMYGLDVTVWSPPHLMGIAGGFIGIYGLLIVVGAGLPARDARPVWRGLTASEAAGLLLFAAALSISMFALGELDLHFGQRDALFYPLLAGTMSAVVLTGAARFVDRPGAATVVAAVYTVFRSLVLVVVWGMGSVEHLTPPVLVLAPALVVDLALWWRGGRGLPIAALLMGPALLLGEWSYRALFDLSSAWEPLRVIASLATITVVVAVGALAGDRLASSMRAAPESGEVLRSRETPLAAANKRVG